MPGRYIHHSHHHPDFVSSAIDSCKQDILSALVTNVERVQQHTPDKQSRTNGGVYIGVAGTVLMNAHLAHLSIQPQLEHRALLADSLVQLADKHLSTTLPRGSPAGLAGPETASRASFLETPVGLATLILCRAIQNHSVFQSYWRPCVRIIEEAVQLAVSEDNNPSLLDDDGCEVLYGRAGTLYALLFIRNELRRVQSLQHAEDDGLINGVQNVASDANITALVDSIILRGKLGTKAYASSVTPPVTTMNVPPLMWRWHRKRYLGGAHGVAGILHMLLMCPTKIIEHHLPDILGTAEWLVRYQDDSGNWPSMAPELDEEFSPLDTNELVQWCHGAPGVLLMLSTLLHRAAYNPQTLVLSPSLSKNIITAIARGASLVYRHGLLRKGVGLCHGVAGSVYALLGVASALEHYTMDQDNTVQSQGHGVGMEEMKHIYIAHPPKEYLARAVHLAHLATTHEILTAQGQMKVPDRPWSLYEGMAGMCCAWGDILVRLSRSGGVFEAKYRSGMPGYDDIEIDETW